MAEKFVCRERALQKLKEAYEEVDKSGFQIRFIVGEPGMGKTVLLDQFTDWVGRKDAKALVTGCSCHANGGEVEDYQPFKDIFQSIVDELGSMEEGKQGRKEKWSRVFGASADVLLKVAPDLIENFVPMGSLLTSVGTKVLEGSGVQQKVEKMKAGNGLVTDVLKLADQYVDMLKLIAGRYRLVLYIDNLQWADRASVELLQRLTGMLRRLPVLLIGCYREADIACVSGRERLPLEAFVTRVKVERGNVFVDLAGECTEEKRRLTDLLLDSDLNAYTEKFREEIFLKTGGNPLFVNELLRMLKENGSLVEDPVRGWQEAEVLKWEVCPLRIEGVIREKVAALEEIQMNVLTIASVQGQFFLLSVVARMTGREEEELLEELTGVLGKQRHLVYEDECFRVNGHLVSRFCFSDAFLRDYLYGEIGKFRRIRLHGEVACLLEELYGEKVEEVCGQLAFQYEQAEEREKACTYMKMWVNKVAGQGDYAGILACCRRGAELAGTEAERYFFRIWRLKVMRKSGNYPADRLKEEYRQLEGPDEEKRELVWERWGIYMLEGDWMGALRWLGEFREKRGEAVIAEGITRYWLGEFEKGRKLLEEHEAGMEGEGEEVAAWGGFYRMLYAFHNGEYERAEEVLDRLKSERRREETVRIALLAEVWLAFLDEDTERMKEGVEGWRKRGGYMDFVGKWMDFFAVVCEEEGQVWNRLEMLKKKYKAIGCKGGVTLYGLAVCRLCTEKGLYEVMAEVWKQIRQAIEKRKEKCYWGELCLLKGKSLEGSGKAEEAGRWLKEGWEWMENCGEKRFVTGIGMI